MGFLSGLVGGLSKAVGLGASVASGGSLAPALIGGASSLAGGFLANKGRADQANISGQFNQASAREQMEFQQRMSNTAHQRQIEDLKKAGLNPLLSAKYGGASSPGGSSATRPMADQKDIISPAISSALAIRQSESDIDLKDSQARLNEAKIMESGQQQRVLEMLATLKDAEKRHKETQIPETEANTLLKQFQQLETNERINVLRQTFKMNEQQLEILKTKFPGLLIEEEIDKTKWGKALRYLMRLNPFLPTTSASANLTPAKGPRR